MDGARVSGAYVESSLVSPDLLRLKARRERAAAVPFVLEKELLPMPPSPSVVEQLLNELQQQGEKKGQLADDLAMVGLRKNHDTLFRFLRTPYSGRVVFLPQCLRSTAACKAEEQNGEYVCRQCGACKIPGIARRAEELGYIGTRILKGGSVLDRLIGEIKPQAVLGVACGIEGLMGILACERAGVPAFCVPLLRAGCSDTDVDLDDLMSIMEASLK